MLALSLNSVSTPPTSCSYSAYPSIDSFVSFAIPVAAAPTAAPPILAAVARPFFNLPDNVSTFSLASSFTPTFTNRLRRFTPSPLFLCRF
nr:MAG TPA: hypothetical protein [Caudoviricetes sp.]DAV20503.1 MAG TPA: hypothetical protein [Caudoviricetes sp.]